MNPDETQDVQCCIKESVPEAGGGEAGSVSSAKRTSVTPIEIYVRVEPRLRTLHKNNPKSMYSFSLKFALLHLYSRSFCIFRFVSTLYFFL